MIAIKFRFVAICDWCNGKRGCAADAAVLGDPEGETLQQFGDRAQKEIVAAGWNCGPGQPTLCTEHNTAANRKKKFPAPEEGSLASIMREVRGS